MDATFKIQQLWQYLKIQDDEVLIVQFYNQTNGYDEFLVTENVNGKLKTHIIDSLQISNINKSFRLIQQLDSSGKHTIPDVDQIKRDERSDY
ncbi:hypothetical protein [Parabacteroides sp.]